MNNEIFQSIVARFYFRTGVVQHDGSLGEIRITPRELSEVLADMFLMGAESGPRIVLNHTVNAGAALDSLTPDQRLEVMSAYCHGCGADDPNCQCWNDE